MDNRPSPFFCLGSNAFPDIGSIGRIEEKNLKENRKKSRNRRPWYPRMTLKVNSYIFGLTKCTICDPPQEFDAKGESTRTTRLHDTLSVP